MSDSNVWDLKAAMELARTLKGIDGFSWDEENIKATGLALMRWCKDTWIDGQPHSAASKAVEITSEAIDNWRKWPGTAALHDLYKSKYRPYPEPTNAFQPLGKRPAILCHRCNDHGTVRLPSGWSEWCTCEYARLLASETPGWLDLVNAQMARRKPELVMREDVPMTPAQLAALSATQKQIVDQALENAEAMLHDPQATKEQKKTARRLVKIYRIPPPKAS